MCRNHNLHIQKLAYFVFQTRCNRTKAPQFFLGATGTNLSIPATSCCCGQHLQGSDIHHAMTARRLVAAAGHRVQQPSRAWLQRGGHGRPVQSRLEGRHPSQASSITWSNPPELVPHTPMSCHLRNRCSCHARVCNGETRCLATMAIITQVTHLFLSQWKRMVIWRSPSSVI